MSALMHRSEGTPCHEGAETMTTTLGLHGYLETYFVTKSYGLLVVHHGIFHQVTRIFSVYTPA